MLPRFVLYYIDTAYLFGHVAVAIAAGMLVAVAWCMRRITVLGSGCIYVPGY